MTKRREFLVYCGALSAGLMLAPGAMLANMIPQSVNPGPGRSSGKDRFRPLLNRKFSLTDDNGVRSGWVKLVEIKDYPYSEGLEQFSLVFRNTNIVDIPEGLYRMENPHAKPCLLYLNSPPSNPGNQRLISYFSLFA